MQASMNEVITKVLKGERLTECFDGRVVVFIKGSYKIPPGRATSKIAILSGDLLYNVKRHHRMSLQNSILGQRFPAV